MEEPGRSNVRIGYARVSTEDQNLTLQIDALKKAGCAKVFTDKTSGAKCRRNGLEKCFEYLKPGDQLLVWRLDRLGRSMAHLVSVITNLRKRQIGFRSLMDGAIDTTTASGELIFNIFAALAQFERELIRERTIAGLRAARARGNLGGHPRLAEDDPRIIMARKLNEDRVIPISQICSTLRISKSTFYRYVANQE
ncbi:MAG: recombinase family protein [Acidobacteriota bacterium]|nr:recombinase family protein [Acidobacteriota bacterium]